VVSIKTKQSIEIIETTNKPRNAMQRNQQTKIYGLFQSFVTTMYLDAGGRPEEKAPNDL